ncbi:hypothetical protein BGX28_002093 [Mortierella sp. GBA30]|nr:hypothetical protein BGX28_002093 [Mortierella sp. GBA30]
MADLGQTESSQFLITIVITLCLLLGVSVEAWPRTDTHVQQKSGASAYDRANLFSRCTFQFFQPVISLSIKRTITVEDIQNQLPEYMKVYHSQAALEAQWRKNVAQGKSQGKNISLFRTILQVQTRAMVPILLFRTVRPLLLFSIPWLLSLFLEYLQDTHSNNQEHNTGLAYGLLLAGAMFAAAFIGALIQAVSRQYSLQLSLQTKVALTAMVYQKALRLSAGSKRSSSTGEVINHMSVDAEVWTEAMLFLSMWISLPIEICMAMWLLYRLLGWSFLAGILALVIMSPFQVYRARVYNRMQKDRLSVMDERIRLTTEILAAIKVIKLYGWESAFKHKILAIRDRELDALKKLGVIFAIMSIIFTSSTLIICLLTLSVYALWGGEGFTEGELTPQTVFVSMTIFSMLRTPIGSLAEATSNTLSALVGTKRIETFLRLEEVRESDIIRDSTIPEDSNVPLLSLHDATFSWTNDDFIDGGTAEGLVDETRPLLLGEDGESDTSCFYDGKSRLNNISISFHQRSITAVLGRVGQGKSSLLSAIIGEMYKIQGTVQAYGRIAYVPQQAWILNASLRENILFGKAYDADRYQAIVNAAGLRPDLEMLPDGDLSEIGERGINLSGGQKQRVSLARAAYQDADIYLMDDPLSAVDAHVDQHLWLHLIGPQGLLKQKTRILVTHGIHHLKEVDTIVLMKGGRIAELGKYAALMAARKTFYQLIKEYATKERKENGKSLSITVAVRTQGLSLTSESHLETEIRSESHAGSEYGLEDGQPSSGTLSTTEEGLELEAADLLVPKAPSTMHENTGNQRKKGEIIEEEKAKEGSVGFKTALTYIQALSYKYSALILVFRALAQASLVGTSLWLKRWITLHDGYLDGDLPPPSLRQFLAVLTLLTITYVILCIVTIYTGFALARIRASNCLHKELISNIFRLPSTFFDTTPLGRILNRFSSDMQGIDDRLPWAADDLVMFSVLVAASLIVVSVTTPFFLVTLPVFIVTILTIQHYYLHASRAIKRIFHISKSPIFQHFNETLEGVSTIRAMGLEDRFITENAAKIDCHTNAHVAYMYSIRWVEVRLQSLSAVVIFLTALAFVWTRGVVDPATAGLAMSFALTITNEVTWLVRAYCDMQNQLVSVERVREYTDMGTEAPERMSSLAIMNREWPPRHGRIVFENYSTRYREGLDLVLKNVSFVVEAGEKIGIIGRTGAGKSSLTLALFRMVEAANSPWAKATEARTRESKDPLGGTDESYRGVVEELELGGKIEIDGIDISTLGLADLRQALAIIPQDPILFAGSVRHNLDPFEEHSDHDLWEALDRSHLKDHVSSLDGGLSFIISQNGENFSVGQRSLICLARALLRKTKVLVLDEATSAVDMQTDELIQRTIRQEFKDRTILTIAHRIKTVMDSDKILVMEKGEVVEFDRPGVLLQRKEASMFFTLAQQAGQI